MSAGQFRPWRTPPRDDLKATFTAPGEPKPLLDYEPKPVESVRYAPGLPLPSAPCGSCGGSGYWENWDGSDNGPCPDCGGHGAGPAGEDFVESLVRQLVEVTVRQEEERLALELEAELDRLQREEPGVYAEVLKRYALLRRYVETNRAALLERDLYGEL